MPNTSHRGMEGGREGGRERGGEGEWEEGEMGLRANTSNVCIVPLSSSACDCDELPPTSSLALLVNGPGDSSSLGGLISSVMVTGSRMESADSSSLSRLQEKSSRASIDV